MPVLFRNRPASSSFALGRGASRGDRGSLKEEDNGGALAKLSMPIAKLEEESVAGALLLVRENLFNLGSMFLVEYLLILLLGGWRAQRIIKLMRSM